jgi:hypothetical protein
MKTYFVFVIQAYDEREPSGNLKNYVELQVICPTERCAMKKAAALVPDKQYRLSMVIEKELSGCQSPKT